MPLIKSPSRSALSENIREMVRAGHPQKQAIAAAYRNAREQGAKFADGGPVREFQHPRLNGPSSLNLMFEQDPFVRAAIRQRRAVLDRPQPAQRAGGGPVASPWFARMAARQVMRPGLINSSIPGRTDRHAGDVAPGSYVLPADTVSALGQGNTMAGAQVLDRMFRSGPYGTSLAGVGGRRAKMPRMGRIRMGRADGGEAEVGVIVAGGEYLLGPEQVQAIGGGDMDRGHSILDAFVKSVRQKHVRTLRKLPGPVQS